MSLSNKTNFIISTEAVGLRKRNQIVQQQQFSGFPSSHPSANTQAQNGASPFNNQHLHDSKYPEQIHPPPPANPNLINPKQQELKIAHPHDHISQQQKKDNPKAEINHNPFDNNIQANPHHNNNNNQAANNKQLQYQISEIPTFVQENKSPHNQNNHHHHDDKPSNNFQNDYIPNQIEAPSKNEKNKEITLDIQPQKQDQRPLSQPTDKIKHVKPSPIQNIPIVIAQPDNENPNDSFEFLNQNQNNQGNFDIHISNTNSVMIGPAEDINEKKIQLNQRENRFLPYFEAFGYQPNSQISDPNALQVLNTDQVPFDLQVFGQLKEQLGNREHYSVKEFVDVYQAAINILNEKKQKQQDLMQVAKDKQTELLQLQEQAKINEEQEDPRGKTSILYINVQQVKGLSRIAQYRVRIKFDGDQEVYTQEGQPSQNPTFNQDFKLKVRNGNSIVQFEVEDLNSNQVVGYVTEKLKKYSHQKKIQDWYILEEKGGALGNPDRQLGLDIQWVYSEQHLYQTILKENDYFEPVIREQEELLGETTGLVRLLELPFERDLKQLKSKLSRDSLNNKKQQVNDCFESCLNLFSNPDDPEEKENKLLYIFICISILLSFYKPNFTEISWGLLILSRFFQKSKYFTTLVAVTGGELIFQILQSIFVLKYWFGFYEYEVFSIVIFCILSAIQTIIKIGYFFIFWKEMKENDYQQLLEGPQRYQDQ